MQEQQQSSKPAALLPHRCIKNTSVQHTLDALSAESVRKRGARQHLGGECRRCLAAQVVVPGVQHSICSRTEEHARPADGSAMPHCL